MNEKFVTRTDAPCFMTISQVSALGIVTQHYLRQAVKEGTVPGFYAGNRFYINVKKLMQKLDIE